MNQQLINRLQKMKRELDEAQNRLQETIFTGTAGGGLVKVEMKGSREVLAVHIEKEILNPDDQEMIQDSIMAAINDANRQIDDESEDIASQFGGLPGLF